MVKIPRKPTPIESTVAWIGSVPSIIFHSCVFAAFALVTAINIFPSNTVLLVWNTLVSLEAIYLAIFIQFTVNRNTKSLQEVEEDIDEIQEDVEDLGEDLGEIQEDIEEISEDIEELSEEDKEEERQEEMRSANIDKLTEDIRRVLQDLETLKKQR